MVAKTAKASAKTAKASAKTVEASPVTRQSARFPDAWTIRLLVPSNPKRGASQARYACYKDGMTVGEYVAACGKLGKGQAVIARADLSWDSERKFIEVTDKAAPKARAKAAPKAAKNGNGNGNGKSGK